MAYLVLLAQCVVSGLFVVSGVTKLADLRAFGRTIGRIVPVKSDTASVLAGLLAVTELVTAGLVWWPVSWIGLGLAALLLIGFAGLGFRQARRSEPVSCRCFGRSGSTLGASTGMRNMLLTCLALPGAVMAGHTPEALTALPLPGIALTVTASIVGVLVTVYLEDLIDLARS